MDRDNNGVVFKKWLGVKAEDYAESEVSTVCGRELSRHLTYVRTLLSSLHERSCDSITGNIYIMH